MQQTKYSPATRIESRSAYAYVTGQKDYALARQRAAQLNDPLSKKSKAGYADFSDTQIIFNGVHHAKK
jgi:hypothetical protein